MIKTLILFLIVNIYWLSFPIIGYSILRFTANSNHVNKEIKKHSVLLLKQHIFLVILSSMVIFCIILSPFVFISYLMQLPVTIIVLLYMLFLLTSIIYLLKEVINRRIWTKIYNIFKLSSQLGWGQYAFLALILFMIGDFILASYLRSIAIEGTDTYYHLTRILKMVADDRFGIHSGYFDGVVDSSYQANFIYALYSIPARALGVAPLYIWEHSFGFFRLMQCVSVFSLGYVLFSRIFNSRVSLFYASLCTMTSMSLLAGYYYTAPYPNQVVMIWITAFIILMISYIARQSKIKIYSLWGTAFLITTSHPTYALIIGLFVFYWFVLHAIAFERQAILTYVKQTWKLLISASILIIGPVISKLMPSHLMSEQNSVTASGTSELFGVTVMSINKIIPSNLLDWIILLLAVVGFIFAIIKTNQQRQNLASILIAIVSFPIVIFYFPPVFKLFYSILPLWVIERFAMMNMLKTILPLLGIVALCLIITNIFNQIKAYKDFDVLTGKTLNILVLVFCFVIISFASLTNYSQLILTMLPLNHYEYEYTNNLRLGLKDLIPKDSVILADDRLSYKLPAIIPVSVISVELGHSTMAADTRNRIDCKNGMLNSLDYSKLMATSTDYVVISKFDPSIESIDDKISQADYLKPIKKIADVTIYKVLPLDTSAKLLDEKSSCRQYQIIESKDFL